ncbi:MAG: hypothetical protein ABSC06_10660 [Rhodopila sp.]|jgi:hypothetical protein
MGTRVLVSARRHIRLTTALAAAVFGIGRIPAAFAQAGIGRQLGVGATADLFNWGAIASLGLYLIAAGAMVMFVSMLLTKHRQNHQVSWGHVLVPLAVAAFAASGGTVITLSAETISGQAASITPATAVQPLAWQ